MFFKIYETTQFVFCQPNLDNWQRPLNWDSEIFPNVQYEDLGSLLDVLNQS